MPKAERIERVFEVGGTRLVDPNPEWSLEKVADHYSASYPELVTGRFEESQIDGAEQVYTMKRSVGAKG